MEETRYVRMRTTIVVVSMLVLPAAAVFGVKMPAESLASKSSGTAPNTVSEKPSAEQSAHDGRPARSPGLFPQSHAAERSTTRPREVVQAGDGGSLSDLPQDGAMLTAASANIDVPGRPTEASHPAASQSPLSLGFASPISSTPSASQALYDGSTLAHAEVLHPAAATAAAPPASGAGLEQFTQIQQRLRALGATHYALETWGTDGQLYRFQCRMAAGHTADYTRQFEATDTDALRTMLTVLEEVEAWKAGRLP